MNVLLQPGQPFVSVMLVTFFSGVESLCEPVTSVLKLCNFVACW